MNPGGIWSGDYLVAECAPFRSDCNVAQGMVSVHIIIEIVKIVNSVDEFPVAERRRERLLTYDEFDVLEAIEGAEDDREEEVAEPVEVPAFTDGFDVADAEAALVDDEPSATAEVPSGSKDFRGLGTETFPGRADVRAHKGSTRPPTTIPPELWWRSSARQKW